MPPASDKVAHKAWKDLVRRYKEAGILAGPLRNSDEGSRYRRKNNNSDNYHNSHNRNVNVLPNLPQALNNSAGNSPSELEDSVKYGESAFDSDDDGEDDAVQIFLHNDDEHNNNNNNNDGDEKKKRVVEEEDTAISVSAPSISISSNRNDNLMRVMISHF